MLKNRPAVAQSSPAAAPLREEEGKAKSWARKVVSGALICLTGGVALSAIDDLVIYQSCSRLLSLPMHWLIEIYALKLLFLFFSFCANQCG